KAAELAKEKSRMDEYRLLRAVEKLSPKVILDIKGTNKPISANVDFYSGFIYDMLNIPRELFTPIFAISRISGWCAHRIEELISGGRIIRPAYKSVSVRQSYLPMAERLTEGEKAVSAVVQDSSAA
ncbi:MAG TPA: citrate/2-methylcitrate synthase, partial [Chitinispirillaceae bacterium]|nr:citrate/2-methylcitrate synthase [Chitinispirillaceae bacterium]